MKNAGERLYSLEVVVSLFLHSPFLNQDSQHSRIKHPFWQQPLWKNLLNQLFESH
jgi:hypothetical protein